MSNEKGTTMGNVLKFRRTKRQTQEEAEFAAGIRAVERAIELSLDAVEKSEAAKRKPRTKKPQGKP